MSEQDKSGQPASADHEQSGSDGTIDQTEKSADTASTPDRSDSGRDVDGAESTDDHDSDRTAVLEAQCAQLEAENTELKNQYLRKQADFENYRKRMSRDKEDAVNYANQQLLLDLTSVIDDFERAIKSAEESRDYDAFHDGIVLIERQLTSMLERKWGLSRFESVGEVFDPQRHEAVTTEPREDHEESVVLEDYQKGYLLRDRVLRSAKVKVSMPASSNS